MILARGTVGLGAGASGIVPAVRRSAHAIDAGVRAMRPLGVREDGGAF
jgi:hypothetical protein